MNKYCQPTLEKIYSSQTIKFKSYCCKNQGWLAVKRVLLDELNLLDKISEKSRQRGRSVYLSDGNDTEIFLIELKRRNINH